MEQKNLMKINRRFKVELALLEREEEAQVEKIDLSLIPKDLKILLSHQKDVCKCCNQHLTIENLMRHRGSSLAELFQVLSLKMSKDLKRRIMTRRIASLIEDCARVRPDP